MLLHGVSGATIIVDAEGRCARANAAAEALLGYDQGELGDRPLADVVVVGQPLHRTDHAHGLADGWWQGEIQVRGKRGELRRVDAWSLRLGDAAAPVTALFLRPANRLGPGPEARAGADGAANADALAMARRWLRESEARFRGAFDASAIGMALVARDGRFLQVNPALCAMVGYPESELLALTFPEITHPDDIETDCELKRQLLAGEISAYQIEKKYLCKSGEVITGRLTVSLVLGPGGEPLYFVAQLQDITQFKASGAALREAEARYRTLVEQIPATVYMDSGDELGRPLYVSPRLEAILGYTAEEWVSEPELWAQRLHPDDRERIVAEIAKANELGRDINLEYRILARDGRIVWVHDEASLLRDEEGQRRFWQGMMVDITERKLAEEELRAAKEAAEEASRLKSVFLSMATHELRTPLTIISGYVELLAESAKVHLSEEERDYLEAAQNGAKTLAALVDDLLDLARIEAGRMVLSIGAVDVAEVMERVRQLVAGQVAVKGLTLDIAIAPDLPPVAADFDRLVQILLNLVGNAIKFTAEGKIELSAREAGAGVEVVVADTGIGIAEDALSRIFDEFRQADSSTTRRFGGTGLGLAIVKRLVQMHGGTIDVESEVGVGSRFILSFPVVSDDLREGDGRSLVSQPITVS